MGFIDAFTADTKIEVKFADFFSLVKEAAKAELIMNAVNCNVPHVFIRETMTGTQEETPEQREIKAINATILANAAALEERDRQKEENQEQDQETAPQEDQAESEGTGNGNE